MQLIIAMQLIMAMPCIAQNTAQRTTSLELLRLELERIHDLDQRDRNNAGHYIPGAQKDSVIAHMVMQDSLNLLRVMAIIDSAGWLGEDAIGRKANAALFLVIQHADARPDLQARYLEVMREAVERGDAKPYDLAMLEDRVAVNQGRPQIYGSQIGWKDGKGFVKPMVDEEHVNERRAAMGLEPLERYTERFGFTWSPPVKRERVLLMGPGKQ